MAARIRTARPRRGGDPLKGMTFRDNVVAWLDRQGGAGDPYKEDPFRLEGRLDLVVGALLALFFVGGYAAFIGWLALTR